MRLLGLDPGLRRTGWGVIEATGNRLSHVANGVIAVPDTLDLAGRLALLYAGLVEVVERYRPDSAGVEETFVNVDPRSTLKLGQARGVVMLVPALAGIPVGEYPANTVKKSLVGYGLAGKPQVAHMVARLLPGVTLAGPDAADALAVAICQAHHAATARRLEATA
ncbi:MAG: crossover junction endodeoxyribonuclease RuvC [Alphaproteobacteria bacterium]|nr:crossover junction endodeoxyribonuclease RuvC [Alphaproteobacteria bacterium]